MTDSSEILVTAADLSLPTILDMPQDTNIEIHQEQDQEPEQEQEQNIIAFKEIFSKTRRVTIGIIGIFLVVIPLIVACIISKQNRDILLQPIDPDAVWPERIDDPSDSKQCNVSDFSDFDNNFYQIKNLKNGSNYFFADGRAVSVYLIENLFGESDNYGLYLNVADKEGEDSKIPHFNSFYSLDEFKAKNMLNSHSVTAINGTLFSDSKESMNNFQLLLTSLQTQDLGLAIDGSKLISGQYFYFPDQIPANIPFFDYLHEERTTSRKVNENFEYKRAKGVDREQTKQIGYTRIKIDSFVAFSKPQSPRSNPM